MRALRTGSSVLRAVGFLALLGPALASLPEGLSAQEPPEPDSAVALDPVVVRVLRTSVGTGTPYPLSVARGEELTRATGGAFLEEALRSVPGLQIQNRYNLAAAERLAIRGFGARAQFGIRGVRVLVDGIPATLPDGQTALDHLDLSSLGRVELLRGPGASLYGNAAGGVLHFQTLPPPAVDARVSVEGAAGSHGLGTLQGSVAGEVGEAGYRLSLNRFTWDGFRTNPLAGATESGAEHFGAADRTVLNATGTLPLGSGELRLVVNGLDMEADNPGSLSDELLAEGDRQAFRFNVLQRTREDIRQGQVGLTWSGALGALDGEVGTWGIRRDFFGAIPPAIVAFDRSVLGLRTLFQGEEETSAGLLSLGGGLEVELQRDDRQNWENDGGDRAGLTLDQDERVATTGLFVQTRLDLDRRLSVTGGLRWDRFSFEADDRFLEDGSDDSGERALEAWSPSVGVVAEPAPGWELFASLAASFETPTTTELTNRPTGAGGFNPELEPTRGRTLEGGVRGRLGQVWSLEATLFQTDLDDELVPFEVPSEPGRTFYRNAGESRHRGMEVTVDGRPRPDWALRAAWTRVNGRFQRYEAGGEDYAGNRLPGLAPNRLDARAAWEPEPGFVEVRALWQDDVPVDDANTAVSPAYTLVDLRAGLDGLEAGGVVAAPWVALANVFDRRYNTAVTVNAFGGRYFEPGPGRSVRLGLRLTWDTR